MSYRLLSYRAPSGEARTGVAWGDDVHDLAKATGRDALAHMGAVLADWTAVDRALAAMSAPSKATRVGAIDQLTLLAPVPEGIAVFCAAANFKDHMLAMAKKLGIPPEPDPRTLDVKPYHFLKPSRQTNMFHLEIQGRMPALRL